MTRSAMTFTIAAWLLVGQRLASAQTLAAAAPQPALVALGSRAGHARSPFPAPLSGQASGWLYSLMPYGHYDVSPSLRLGVRVPMVVANVTRPAGSIVEEVAWGNAELSLWWGQRLTAEIAWSLGLAAGAPAKGSAIPTDEMFANKALALGSALAGWGQPELYAPGRVPLTPAGRVDVRRGIWQAGAELKLPLLVRAGSGGATRAVAVEPIGVATVATAHASASPWEWLSITVSGWVTWHPVWAARASTASLSRIQVVVQPRLMFRVAGRGFVALDSAVPLGAELGGAVYGLGLQGGMAF